MHGWHPRSVVDIVTTDSSPINLSELEPAEFDTCVHNHVERLKRVHCEVFQEAHQNIKNAQKRQKTDYDNRHKTKKVYSVGEKVLLYNLRRADRKGGKQCDIWNGPYSVTKVHDNGTYTLSNSKGPMKQKAHAVNLKPFHSSNGPVQIHKAQHLLNLEPSFEVVAKRKIGGLWIKMVSWIKLL